MEASSSSSSSSGGDAMLRVNQWFEYLTGYHEPEWRQLKEDAKSEGLFRRHPDDEGKGGLVSEDVDGPNLIVKNLKTGKEFKAGAFSTPSLEQLRSEVEALASSASRSAGDRSPVEFHILTRKDSESYECVDVAALQALPENRFATFQVASNFNGVEAIADSIPPDSPSFTEGYYMDRTQGPAASISAGAAAIARVHAAFWHEAKTVEEWAQTSDRQVEFLEKLREHFPTRNGYVTLRGREPSFPAEESEERADLLKLGRVGVHKNVQVTTGHRSAGLRLVNDPEQVVDQVFCAALNIGQGFSGAQNTRTADCASKCQFILDLAYEGTYLAAIRNRRKRLFLTLIGGGVFGNRPEWIHRAILNAHLKYANHPSSCLEEVVLVLFSPSDVYRKFGEWLRDAAVPYKWFECRKGKKHLVMQE
ncbi:Macro domain-containing protein [Balamuthia mandrillaris]